MKILLLNDNPVVNKLVTLSAQKTSDELDIVTNVNDVVGTSYDLVVVDDSIGSDDVLEALRSKLAFSKSLYICSRDAVEATGFDATLKKPFLPTDLVELFAMFDKEIEKDADAPQSQSVEEGLQESDTAATATHEEEIEELEDIDGMGDLDHLDELDEFEDIALDEEVDLEMDDLELDVEGGEDLVLDDDSEDETLIGEESLEDENLGESVLDDEEAQKVKELLDETDEEPSDDFTLELDEEGDTFHFDPHVASKELGLPLDVVEDFVNDFIEQALEYKEELYASAVAQDYTRIHEISHKLKGVAANLRVENALNALTTINTSSDEKEIKEKLNQFYEIIDKLKSTQHADEEVDFDMALDLEDEADADIGDDDTLNELDEAVQEEEIEDQELEELESDSVEELEDFIDEAVTEELALEEKEEEIAEDEELDFDMALDLEDEADADIAEDEDLLTLDDESEELELDSFEDESELENDSEEELEDIIDEAVTEELEEEGDSVEELEDMIDEEVTQELTEEASEEPQESDDIADIEQQIQEAVEDLSEEDLESELDDETLLEIAASEIDSLDALSSKDLKLALGEEVEDDEPEEEVTPEDVQELLEDAEVDEDVLEAAEEDLEEEKEAKIEGVDALKKLLKALDDKEIAASMKDMKITINIELGSNNE
ncbi:hypothetical protein [Sulfurimonas paralvinellae]|uniref:HPt domain-containing protein n=1 Tax=Sulfurimonas paralvinellae TaxID=317658 RepID=A0A7M1B6D4_9BACT|nr:hypothetical protein [Sulfurimonas paralvinellae]QOP45076.1 hypothetical protein FM071_01695 [Sulfurimonas paralvinellae]